MVRQEIITDAAVTIDMRSAQKRLRAEIAGAIIRSGLPLAEQATAVEAELLVQGFEARVMPVDRLGQQSLPLAG